MEWTSKPPIGTKLRQDEHWSVQGLIGAWAFNEGSGTIVSDLCNSPAKGTLSLATWDSTGVQLGSSSSVDYGNASKFMFNQSQQFTLFSYSKVLASSAYQNAFRKDSGIGNRAFYGVRLNTANKLEAVLGDTLAGLVVFAGSTVISSGLHTLAIVRNASATQLYLDGKLDGSGALPVGTWTVSAGNLASKVDGGSESWRGGKSLDLVYSRGLSPTEMASISSNPWQIFEPRIRFPQRSKNINYNQVRYW